MQGKKFLDLLLESLGEPFFLDVWVGLCSNVSPNMMGDPIAEGPNGRVRVSSDMYSFGDMSGRDITEEFPLDGFVGLGTGA